MPTPKGSDLAARLREAVQASSKSLRQIAREAEMDAGNLSRFMKGTRDFPIERYAAVGRAVGLELGWIERPPPAAAKKKPARKKGTRK